MYGENCRTKRHILPILLLIKMSSLYEIYIRGVHFGAFPTQRGLLPNKKRVQTYLVGVPLYPVAHRTMHEDFSAPVLQPLVFLMDNGEHPAVEHVYIVYV